MRNKRVYEVMKETGLKLAEIKSKLAENGIEIVSHLSVLNDEQAELVNKLFNIKPVAEYTVTEKAIEKADNGLQMGILVQTNDSGFGISSVEFPEVPKSTNKSEMLTEEEVKKYMELMKTQHVGDYMKDILFAKECEVPEVTHLIEWINSKRVFSYTINGIRYATILPRNREIVPGRVNALNMKLLSLAMAWIDYLECKKDEKQEYFNKFTYYRRSIALDILKGIASKEFKYNYRMRFKGLTGVALTGNCSIDGCNIPAWYAKKHDIQVGDYILAFRHPIQNLFLTLRVESISSTEDFTENELRMNSMVFTWLGGDHDGDKLNFIPLTKIYFDNKRYFHNLCNFIEFQSSCLNILPSALLEYEQTKNTFNCVDNHRYGHRTISTLDMLRESKKSMNFAKPLSVDDYIENQFETVLNMRTVKEGTGAAGSFCNWLMEVATLAKLDLKEARGICDIIQQAALDSKHNKSTGNGYTDTIWFKLTRLRFEANKKDIVTIAEKMISILAGTDNWEPLEEDGEGCW